MRNLLVALLASIALVAPACGDTSEPASEGFGPVDVRIQQVLDFSKGRYTEGSYSYVRVERPDGEEVLKERLGNDRECSESECVSEIVLPLVPGEYRFVSFQRPCEGNCGFLDPPTDRCDRLVGVRAEEAQNVVVTVRPGEGCTIRS
jgi:hypothetical protein